ncbi:MAG TPA: DUF6152 family protein [Methylomirabilota bacterium]|jgi:hypothetical protein|nr:DUF6152 family protein [Methylomirabilota bacterium]
MFRSTILRAAPAAVGLAIGLAGATAAIAHHGWSGYDASKPLTVTGTIKVAGYEHPHGYVRLETKEKTWVVTLAPPSRMENRGLPAATLKDGAQATVMGYPSRTDPDEMRAEWIAIDGKTTQLR